jgi:hypothetical protein
MDLVTEAMASLLPKLVELLKEEYKLQEGVKEDVKSLFQELGSTHAALRKLAEAVPRHLLDEQVRFWAIDARELSYDMEDVVGSFLVNAEGSEPASTTQTLVDLMMKMTDLFEKGKTHSQIANAVADIRDQIPGAVAHGNPASTTNILDPCLLDMSKGQKEIVGIEGARDEVVRRLTDEDDSDAPKKQLKTLSLLGIDGLGKTTLAKAVYDCLRVQFEYGAFVRVGRSSNMQKVFKDVLAELKGYEDASILEESQLIDKLRGLLENKRYVRRHSTSVTFNVIYFKQ